MCNSFSGSIATTIKNALSSSALIPEGLEAALRVFHLPILLHWGFCGIENNLGNKRELSSEFIYKVIDAFGGTDKFYRQFFLLPLVRWALWKEPKTIIIMTIKLQEAATPFIRKTWKQQTALGAKNNRAICIGSGKNMKMLETLNADFPYFEKIISLEHPRFIMQYREKKWRSMWRCIWKW